jgi:hypothetical protein
MGEIETPSDIEEVVHIYEPEVERILGEEEKRSKDIMSFQEVSDENTICQVGNEMGSLEDLIECQEGRA